MSYSIVVECQDGSVQLFTRKHINVPSKRMMEMDAMKESTGLISDIRNGESQNAKENRLIRTFVLGTGTLHCNGASFNLEWDIDENFNLHITASDPERVKEVQSKGFDSIRFSKVYFSI